MKYRNKKSYIVLTLVILAIILSQSAYSAPILQGFINNDGSLYTYDVDDEGVIRSAEATFDLDEVNNLLTITLTNTASLTSSPNQVLTGLFFDFSGGLTGAPSVNLTTGSLFINPDGITSETATYTLNQEWAYLTGINDMNGGRGDYGISATGLNPDGVSSDGWVGFGDKDVIDQLGADNNAPDGAGYGLVGNSRTGLWPAPTDYYVQDSVTITWGILDVGSIDNVWFLYGTDYEDTPPVPEPSTMILIGTGLIGLVSFGRKFRKDN